MAPVATHSRVGGLAERDVSAAPSVSVVIPTYHRPELVLRAVRTALDQTMADLEVITVVDGRDPATCEALATIADPRVRVHVPDRHLGNADARNAGVALARAPWVAFLDDDDCWMPDKLARQLAAATQASAAQPIVVCHMLARTTQGDLLWPRRLPREGEDWSEYFFCRRTPFTGEGMVTMSTIFTTRALVTAVPFSGGLAHLVDPDWLLRALRRPEVDMTFVAGSAPLIVWHIEHDRPRITNQRQWTTAYEWARRNRDLFSARGYAAFVLHVIGSNAAVQGDSRAFLPLMREARRHGQPALVDVASHVANFVLPARVQRRVALWYGRATARG
jgi:glycosyltransferase involved in cell wall biosynthesis